MQANAPSHTGLHAPSNGKLKYKVDIEKPVVINNLEKRGFTRTYTDDDWHFYFANVGNAKALFNPENGFRFADHHIINHFPNHYELTRKDLMVKNIKRYKKEWEKSEDAAISKRNVLDFVPVTYSLPADYSLFVEEYKKSPHSMWIMKPSSKARGIGIFIITKLSQIKKWAKDRWSQISVKDQYVVSRYINNPLLIGGKKFDLRLYVLVTSYKPIKTYLYREGFARFCTTKYTNDINEIDNLYVHLTNVAIQKNGEEYNSKHGGKWNTTNLRIYLEATRGKDVTDELFNAIKFVIKESIRSCQNIMINDKHCFELYGYDMLIDNDLKPWLLEVNASPSLTTTTSADRIMKDMVLADVMNIVIHKNYPSVYYKDYRLDQVHPSSLGGFEVLMDETLSDAPYHERRKPESRRAKFR